MNYLIREDWITEARAQRRRMTPAESALWEALRGRKLAGLKFRRIQAIRGLYADFYCAELGLVIELDGAVHLTQVEYDQARTAVLNGRKLRVIRFQNEEVLNHLTAVLSRIESESKPERPEPSPTPFVGEGGA